MKNHAPPPSTGAGSGFPPGDFALFEDFLSLAVLHKNYAQHFSPPDLYVMGLVEDVSVLPASRIASLWRKYACSGRRGAVNLYLTMPYCLKRCRYCIFFKKLLEKPGELEEYKDRLVSLARFLGPVLRRLEFANLFFGGGTPSLFTERQLREIFAAAGAAVKVRPGGEKTFECEPLTATRGKLAAARDAGFDRVSLGVQSLGRSALRLLGRAYQTEAMVSSFLRDARELGFSDINADLIIGLEGDTPRGFAAGFSRLLAMRPDTVSIYQFIPNQEYLDSYCGGSQAAFHSASVSFRKKVYPLLAGAAVRAGYEAPGEESFGMADRMAGSVVFRRQDAEIKKHYAMGELGPADAYLTLGWQGDSYIPGQAFYQTLPLERDPAGNSFLAVPLEGRKAMEFYLLRRLASYNDVDRGEFRALFGKDPSAVFGRELRALSRAGLLRTEGSRLLFAKTDMKTRFLVSMVFPGARRLERRVNEWLAERRLELRFGELSYSAGISYTAAGGPELVITPKKGARSSPALEKLARAVFARAAAEPDLGRRVAAFERLMVYAAKKNSGRASI